MHVFLKYYLEHSQYYGKKNNNLFGVEQGGHTPRHTIANHFLDTGFSLVEIQSILLHAHPSTTMVYLKKRQPSKLANNTLKSFYAAMDAR
jgi:site-specific recombinase XerD